MLHINALISLRLDQFTWVPIERKEGKCSVDH